MRLKTLREKRAKLHDENAALAKVLEKDDRLATTEEIAAAEIRKTEIGALDQNISFLKNVEDDTAANAEPAGRIIRPEITNLDPAPLAKIPATYKRHASIRNFKGPDADRNAYRFGMQLAAGLWRNPQAMKYCDANGLQYRAAMGENDNTAGGFLVADEVETTLIDLREQYGVFRQYANNEPMKSDTKLISRRVSGLTAYFIQENPSSQITASQLAFDGVNLVAKTLATLTLHSIEVGEDAFINLGDKVAGEIAYAMANKEDDCGFNGTGASTYGGIQGIRPSIGSAAVYTAGGSTSSGKDTWGEIVLGDFHNTIGLLPAYAHQRGQLRWFCSAQFFYTVMQALMYAAGGNTIDMIASGTGMQFLGYPVVFSQVWPTATAVTSVCCAIGALELTTSFGNRRGVTIATSDQRYFEFNQMAIRGTERFDINNHDIGTSTAAGPIAALTTSTT